MLDVTVLLEGLPNCPSSWLAYYLAGLLPRLCGCRFWCIAKLSSSWKFHWNWAKLALISINTTHQHPPTPTRESTKPNLDWAWNRQIVQFWITLHSIQCKPLPQTLACPKLGPVQSQLVPLIDWKFGNCSIILTALKRRGVGGLYLSRTKSYQIKSWLSAYFKLNLGLVWYFPGWVWY